MNHTLPRHRRKHNTNDDRCRKQFATRPHRRVLTTMAAANARRPNNEQLIYRRWVQPVCNRETGREKALNTFLFFRAFSLPDFSVGPGPSACEVTTLWAIQIRLLLLFFTPGSIDLRG